MAIVDEEPPVPESPREAANDRESHKGLRDVFIISLECSGSGTGRQVEVY